MNRELAIVLAIVGSSWAAITFWIGPEDEKIARYCSYGSVSIEQYEGCKEHVTGADVDDADGNAGRYGRGNLHACLDDAGPMCSDEDTEPLIDPGPDYGDQPDPFNR